MAEHSSYTVGSLIGYLSQLRNCEQQIDEMEPVALALAESKYSPVSLAVDLVLRRKKLDDWPDVRRFRTHVEAAGLNFDSPGATQFAAGVCRERAIDRHDVRAMSLDQFCNLIERPSVHPTASQANSLEQRGVADEVRLTTDVGATARMTRQEAAKRLEQLRLQGESFTSQGKLAVQIGCSSYTVHKAIKITESLQEWARRPPAIAKVQRMSAVVMDKTPQSRELNPEDEVAVREYLEREDISPEDRALFNAKTEEDQIAFVNVVNDDPDRHGLDETPYARRH